MLVASPAPGRFWRVCCAPPASNAFEMTTQEVVQYSRIGAGAGSIDKISGDRVYLVPKPHRSPVALVPVLQRSARDVPELPFPEHTDLFQLLWCPNRHDQPWYGPSPITVWRRAAEVTEPLASPPPPRTIRNTVHRARPAV